jgi:sugar phosphate isomerase/epimerase
MGPTALAETIDTATNTVRRTASKVVAATFDPAHLFAVPITLA